jgi:predicted amidohydrolase
MRVRDLPREFSAPVRMTDKPVSFLLRGGSAIIGPNGQYVVEPCFDRETTIMAQLDLSAVDEERMTLDVSGHYNRPDVFNFQVRSSRNSKLQEDSS